MTKKIVLIGNPVAGGGATKKIEEAVQILKNRGHDVHLMLTSKKGDAESFAKKIASEQKEDVLVIAAGGDGTYNEVANGLVHSDITMAILPLGTTSVLARELKISMKIESAVETALNGTVQTVHVGRITLRGADESPVSRHFLLMAGVGFDGETVFNVSDKIKKYSGEGAYILSGIRSLIAYDPEPITIKDKNISVLCYTAIIGKASCYGGDFRITPDARLTDPYFYVFVTHKKSRLALLRYVFGIIKGYHLNFKDIGYFKTTGIEIEGSAHIQIDGDYIGTAPARIEIVPDA
ncbi:MAG: diacylglycerol kinase family lipid kinase, partial [Nitrospirae bacterium]|nr:diacylglycerol kinase family lipid kinase [Nitrospirota bacterium]